MIHNVTNPRGRHPGFSLSTEISKELTVVTVKHDCSTSEEPVWRYETRIDCGLDYLPWFEEQGRLTSIAFTFDQVEAICTHADAVKFALKHDAKRAA